MLTSSTARLIAWPSPDGSRVAIMTPVAGGERLQWQIMMIPFDSGTARAVTPPLERIDDLEFSTDGARLYYLVPASGMQERLVEYDIATAQARERFTIADSTKTLAFDAMADGNFLFLDTLTRQIAIIAPDGAAIRTLPPIREFALLSHARPRPGGGGAAVFGWDLSEDSVLVLRLNLEDGRTARMAAFVGVGWGGAAWMRDGSFQIAIRETDATTALYTIPADGGPARRLGVLPYAGELYTFLADGRQVLVTDLESREDVWLVKASAP